jgi:hypothetical protein
MKNLIICLCILSISVIALSQNIENLQTSIQGNKAIVSYDLGGTSSYYIDIYSSKDTFTNKLRFAIGDLGSGIRPGKDKKIIINLELEKIIVNEDLKFQINAISEQTESARVNDSSLKYMPLYVRDVRRGKINEIYWPATNTSIFINIELYQNGQFIYPIASNVPNSGVLIWNTLRSLKIGENYQIKIIDVNNSLNLVRSNLFMIKAKVPLVVKLIPFVGTAATIIGVVSLFNGGYYY